MTTTQRPPIGRADTAPTAAQKVVAAMWTLGTPATPKAIAEAAGVGYSTVTPILRNLLADEQAVKTDSATGPAEWQLTATLPTPTPIGDETPVQQATATNPASDPSAAASVADGHDHAYRDDIPHAGDTPEADHTPQAGDAADADSGADPTPDPQPDTDTDTDTDGAPKSGTPAAEHATPEASADAGQQPTGRTYRKPVQPRRPKGELRAAVLTVLTGSPEQAFKVSEVCKAIDAANADGTSNKAGAGAVANALDKLVTSGDAQRVEEAKYATYQAAPAGG